MPTVKCDQCGAEREAKPGKHKEAKLPKDYKQLGGKVLCKTCRNRAYVMRAVSVPVSIPMEGGDMDEFRRAIFAAWGQATNASNIIVTTLARAEQPRREGDGVRLEPLPKLNTYEAVRRLEPAMDPASVAALDQSVKGKYGKSRFDVFCRGVQALPVYRFPTPYPVRKTEWSVETAPGGERCVRVRFGRRWWVIKLIVEARQIAAWNQLLSGDAERCELALLGRTVTESDERPGLRMRVPGKPTTKMVRVMAKLVGWFPRREPARSGPVLSCTTQSDRLWMYQVGDDGEPKYLHADWITGLDRQLAKRLGGLDIEARATGWRHQKRLDRMAHDTKHEKRWPKRRRRKLLASQDKWARKYRDRMNDYVHLASKMLAEFCKRNNVSKVIYNDSNKEFSARFPYAALAEKLAYKLQERGIEFDHV